MTTPTRPRPIHIPFREIRSEPHPSEPLNSLPEEMEDYEYLNDEAFMKNRRSGKRLGSINSNCSPQLNNNNSASHSSSKDKIDAIPDLQLGMTASSSLKVPPSRLSSSTVIPSVRSSRMSYGGGSGNYQQQNNNTIDEEQRKRRKAQKKASQELNRARQSKHMVQNDVVSDFGHDHESIVESNGSTVSNSIDNSSSTSHSHRSVSASTVDNFDDHHHFQQHHDTTAITTPQHYSSSTYHRPNIPPLQKTIHPYLSDDPIDRKRHINLLLDKVTTCPYNKQKKLMLRFMNLTPKDLPVDDICSPHLSSSLIKLSLAANRLSAIPPRVVTSLVSLRSLDLQQCDLLVLPDKWSLPKLTKLDLSHNRLNEFPPKEFFEGLPSLRSLSLYGNKLCDVALPVDEEERLVTKGMPKRLESLNLGYNNLCRLPDDFSTFFSSLKTLVLQNNLLTVISKDICDMNLSVLDVSLNPLVQPPAETCERGIHGMRRYYARLEEENRECSRRARKRRGAICQDLLWSDEREHHHRQLQPHHPQIKTCAVPVPVLEEKIVIRNDTLCKLDDESTPRDDSTTPTTKMLSPTKTPDTLEQIIHDRSNLSGDSFGSVRCILPRPPKEVTADVIKEELPIHHRIREASTIEDIWDSSHSPLLAEMNMEEDLNEEDEQQLKALVQHNHHHPNHSMACVLPPPPPEITAQVITKHDDDEDQTANNNNTTNTSSASYNVVVDDYPNLHQNSYSSEIPRSDSSWEKLDNNSSSSSSRRFHPYDIIERSTTNTSLTRTLSPVRMLKSLTSAAVSQSSKTLLPKQQKKCRCEKCGMVTHKMNWMRKMVPLTVPRKVNRGVCLRCSTSSSMSPISSVVSSSSSSVKDFDKGGQQQQLQLQSGLVIPNIDRARKRKPKIYSCSKALRSKSSNIKSPSAATAKTITTADRERALDNDGEPIVIVRQKGLCAAPPIIMRCQVKDDKKKRPDVDYLNIPPIEKTSEKLLQLKDDIDTNEDVNVNNNDEQQKPWVVDRALPLIDQVQTLNEPSTVPGRRRLTSVEDDEAPITGSPPPIVRPTIASLSVHDQLPPPIRPPIIPPPSVTESPPPQSQPPMMEPLATPATTAPPLPDTNDDQSTTSSHSSSSSSSITINDTLKVIFVGMANVGKTSIIRRLIKGPDTTIPLPDERTIGVDIYDWTPPPPPPSTPSSTNNNNNNNNNESIYPPNKSVKFSVWDFAGQHVYHATHELFFSPRALYVIVWDMAVHNEATYIQRRQIHHRQNDLESGPFQLDSSSSESSDDDDDDDVVVNGGDRRRRRHGRHGVSPSTTLRQDSEMRRTADHALRQDIDDKVQFWIDCIQSRVPGAAILIVASFSDCFSKDCNNNTIDDMNNNGTNNNPTKIRRHSHRQHNDNKNNNNDDEIKRRCQALKKRVLGMEQRRMKGIETRWAKLLKEKNANTDDAARLQRLLSPLNRPKLIFGGSASYIDDNDDDDNDNDNDGRGGVIHVSAKDYLNFDTLRNTIVGIATGRERITDWDLPVFGGHVGARIPQVWIEVRGVVREMRRRFKVVEWRHFLKTLEETRGIENERDVSDALHFLTDVGELSYFGSRMEASDLDREFPMQSSQMYPNHCIRPFADDDYDTDDEEYPLSIDGCCLNRHDRNSSTSTPLPNLSILSLNNTTTTPSQSRFSTPPTSTTTTTTTTTTPNQLSNLSQFIFLNPRWLVAALACILRHDLNREIATIRRLHDLPPSPYPYRDAGSNNCPLVTSTDACYLWDAQKVTKKAASRAWDYRGEINGTGGGGGGGGGEAMAEEGGGGGEEVILRPYEFLQLLLVRFGIFVPIDLTAIDNVCFGGRDYGCYEGICNAQEGGLQCIPPPLPSNAPPTHDNHHHNTSSCSSTSVLSEDESSSRLQPSTCYFLPSLLGSGAEPAEAWSYKSREAWKVTLCHSLLFPDGVPPGMMERIIAFVLRDVNTAVRHGGIGAGLVNNVVAAMGEGNHHERQGVKEINDNNNNNNNAAASESFRVHEILCWRTAFLLKLGMEVDGRSSIVEIFTSLVDRENPICVGSDSMGVGMCRLILSAKGQEGDGGRKIWRGGYDLVIRAICRVMVEYSGLEFEKHAVCPECLAKKRASEASVWSINYLRKALRNNDTYIRCNHGHRVLLSLVSGYRKKQVLQKDDHHVSNDDGLLLHGADAKQRPLFDCGGHSSSGGGKSVCDLLGGVVLVGLWDAELGAIVTAGSGFVIDKKRGLIVTAAHTLVNVDGRGEAPYGEDYLGRKRGEVVVGVIPTTRDVDGNNDGVGMRPTAVFRYFAEIAAKDPLIADKHKCEVDACILRITSRMENDVSGDGRGCKDQPQIPLKHDKEAMKREHLQELKCTETCSIEENVRILGFNQGGEGLTTPGTHLNRCADFAKGHVCMFFHTEETEDVVHPTQELRPREEIVVICTTIGGHSGGPCVNHQGEVIGILSRADPAEKQRCYLVPTRRWKGLVKKAKKRSHPMNEFGF